MKKLWVLSVIILLTGCGKNGEPDETIRARISELRHRDPSVRWEAVESLAKVGPAAVPALRDAVQDKNLVVRREAARALERTGRRAVAAAGGRRGTTGRLHAGLLRSHHWQGERDAGNPL